MAQRLLRGRICTDFLPHGFGPQGETYVLSVILKGKNGEDGV